MSDMNAPGDRGVRLARAASAASAGWLAAAAAASCRPMLAPLCQTLNLLLTVAPPASLGLAPSPTSPGK